MWRKIVDRKVLGGAVWSNHKQYVLSLEQRYRRTAESFPWYVGSKWCIYFSIARRWHFARAAYLHELGGVREAWWRVAIDVADVEFDGAGEHIRQMQLQLTNNRRRARTNRVYEYVCPLKYALWSGRARVTQRDQAWIENCGYPRGSRSHIRNLVQQKNNRPARWDNIQYFDWYIEWLAYVRCWIRLVVVEVERDEPLPKEEVCISRWNRQWSNE